MKSRHLDKHMFLVVEGLESSVERLTNASTLDRRDAERVPLFAHVSYVTDARRGLWGRRSVLFNGLSPLLKQGLDRR
jgi:hypothetical protein